LKKILYLSLLAAILITIVTGCQAERFDLTFEEASGQPQLREKYVEKIIKEIGKPNEVKEINYINTPEEWELLKRVHDFTPDPEILMTTNPITEIQVPRFGKEPFLARISIFPSAFSGEILKIENDFISSLLHEYHHVRMLNRKEIDSISYGNLVIVEGEFKGKYNLSLLQVLLELTAIRETLQSSLEISSYYRIQRMNMYFNYYIDIWNYEGGMNLEFIRSLKVEFFEQWMLEIPGLIKQGDDKKTWYLIGIDSGEKYPLPEEITRRFQNGKG
jgi:hypothetical protein